MLTFQYKDFEKALEGCLMRFKHNILISASLCSVRELLLAGKEEYAKENCWQLLNHNAYAIRILASTIFASMYKLSWEEEHRERIDSHIEVSESNQGIVKVDLSGKMHGPVWLDEPEMVEWCKVFNIPFSLNVDLSILYYSGDM